MISIEKLENYLQAEKENLKIVEVFYPNGGAARGTVRKLRFSPLKVVLDKLDGSGSKSGKHRVEFAHAKNINVILLDGTVEEF